MRGIIENRRSSRSGKPTRHLPGQGLVEMAMIALIMVILVAGIVDFGIFMYRYVQASNCVRESARMAVVRDSRYSDPPYCRGAGLTPTASADPASLDGGEMFTATINVPYDYLALDSLIPMPALSVTAATSMRMEPKTSIT
jgi:hypothetical protein